MPSEESVKIPNLEKLQDFSEMLKKDKKLGAYFKKLKKQLRAEREKDLKNIRAILTPQEYSQYVRYLERRSRKPLRLRMFGEYEEGSIEKVEAVARKKAEHFLQRY